MPWNHEATNQKGGGGTETDEMRKPKEEEEEYNAHTQKCQE